MTIRLRPHHLLCMLTYVGRGYDPAFVANYDRIAARLSRGEDVIVVAGPDDICAPLLAGDAPHCREDRVLDRDARAARDVGALLGRSVTAGTVIRLDSARLRAMREAFRAGATRAACGGCEWSGLCDAVAGGGFAGARVEAGHRA